VQLWDTLDRRNARTLDTGGMQGTPETPAAAVGPNGQWVVLTDLSARGGGVYWDLRSGTPAVNTVPNVAGAPVTSPDGRMLVTSRGHTVNLPEGVQAPPALGPGPTADLAFSPDGSVLAAGDSAGRIVLWNRSLTDRLGTLVPLLGRYVTALAFSRDGRTLAEASLGGDIQLWDLTTNRPLGLPLPTDNDPVLALAFSPDGTTLQASGQHIPFQRFQIGPAAAAAAVCSRAHGGLTAEQWKIHLPTTPYRPSC
jgi:WD40 repeat protein